MSDTYTPAAQSNGQHASSRVDADLPRVEFGTGATQDMPHEWAAWILTTMRNAELANEKPRKFSDLLAAAAMAAR